MTAVAPGPRAVTTPATVGDPRDPVSRLAALFDPGTTALVHPRDGSGVVTAQGRIDGAKVVAYCTDATRSGGALGHVGSVRIVETIETAIRLRVPVIGLWHSGGARLPEGVASLDGIGRMFSAMVRASGSVPQISVVLGAAAGGAAYGSALTDLVVMAPDGRMFVTGPDVVRSVTGEQVDQEGLGGPAVHGEQSGVAHVIAASEGDAIGRARMLTGFFTRPGVLDPSVVADPRDPGALLPARKQRAYDVRPVLSAIIDPAGPNGGSFLELQAKWAPNLTIGFGRLAGRSIGLIANNPLRLGGCLDSAGAEKAARFVRMCSAFGIPLAVIVDVPGYLPGLDQEREGIVRRGAKLLHAFAGASVPRVTVVTRKAFGGAYIAMNSRSLGATAAYAWPGAEIAVMGASAAVGVLHRRELAATPAAERDAVRARLAEGHDQAMGGLAATVAHGYVDAVIHPAQTRAHLVAAIASAAGGRGAHGNIPL